eukprot:3502913-Alexandrium_andersonii.AAC.1
MAWEHVKRIGVLSRARPEVSNNSRAAAVTNESPVTPEPMPAKASLVVSVLLLKRSITAARESTPSSASRAKAALAHFMDSRMLGTGVATGVASSAHKCAQRLPGGHELCRAEVAELAVAITNPTRNERGWQGGPGADLTA